MKKFKFIDITTADVAFIAYGKSLNELFENAALAMFEEMINTSQVEPKEKIKISIEGVDLNSLLFRFLNELLVYVDSKGMAFSRFNVRVDEKNFKLNAECFGEKITEKHETRTEVKAATYHGMKIEKKNGLWQVRVILDI